jgi:hypothetical protein
VAVYVARKTAWLRSRTTNTTATAIRTTSRTITMASIARA